MKGTFTLQQALTAALEGTGLTSRITSPTTVVVELRIDSESVEVAAGLPRVTSPGYPTSVTETPQTLQVIPRTVIDEQGAFSLGDVLRNVPGITLQAGEGGGASNTAGESFNMRGFNANNSMFVDGVRDDGLITRDTFNLEQVEVFLGPTGTDVGRGTGAGYVNMVTKAPRPSSSYGGGLTYGTNSQTRATADLNVGLPIGEDGSWLSRSAVRLNALFQDGGVPGRDEVTNERRGVAPSLSLGLGSPTRVTVSGQFVRQDNVPDYGLPGAAYPDGPLIPGGATASNEVDQTNFYGTPGSDFDDVEQDSYLGKIEHDLSPGLTVRNQTRFNRTHRLAVISTATNAAAFDPVTEMVTISRQANERKNEIFSNQTSASLRLLRGGVTHELTAGLEFIGENQFAPTLAGAGTRPPVSIYAPNPDIPVIDFNLAPTGAYTKGGTDTVAGYVFDTVNIQPRAGLGRASPRALQHRLRFEHRRRCADGSRSGRHGVERQVRSALPSQRPRQRLRVSRPHRDAAGNRQLHAQFGRQQRQQPQRRSADLGQLRDRDEVGSVRAPSLGEPGDVPDAQRERHLHDGCDDDSADVQPGRQAEA